MFKYKILTVCAICNNQYAMSNMQNEIFFLPIANCSLHMPTEVRTYNSPPKAEEKLNSINQLGSKNI